MCNEQIRNAVHVLKNGGIIAYPTESVYGLGCDPFNEAAVKKLIRLKKREVDKGFILIASDFLQLRPLLEELQPDLEAQVRSTWPGAITWLWPAKKSTSTLLKGDQETLAIRLTAHPLAKKLCTVFGGAIVSTSANISGEESARDFTTVVGRFSNQLDFIVEGNAGNFTSPTEIRDVRSGRIIRPAR